MLWHFLHRQRPFHSSTALGSTVQLGESVEMADVTSSASTNDLFIQLQLFEILTFLKYFCVILEKTTKYLIMSKKKNLREDSVT